MIQNRNPKPRPARPRLSARVGAVLHALSLAMLAPFAGAAELDGSAQERARGRVDASREGVRFHVSVRTPEQVAAFYEGRGVARKAINEMTRACFVTVFIANQREDVVWLELDRWRFSDAAGRPVRRIPRPEWHALWEKLEVPLPNRSVFNWTQLPEVRDLRPQEPVGGNVTLVPPSGKFRLAAHFALGSEKEKGELVIETKELSCPSAEAGKRGGAAR